MSDNMERLFLWILIGVLVIKVYKQSKVIERVTPPSGTASVQFGSVQYGPVNQPAPTMKNDGFLGSKI